APQLEAVEDLLEPAPLDAADETIRGHTVVVEREFAGVDALVAEFLELAAHREAWPLLGDQHAHALVRRLRARIGLHQQSEAIAVETVGDPGLAAGDRVGAVADALGDGADRLQVGAAVGLGEPDAAAQFAGGEARQEVRLLLLGAVALYHHCHD